MLSDMITLVLLVGLVAGQTEMAPAECLAGSAGKAANAGKLALLGSINRLEPIAFSKRTDIPNDMVVARELLDDSMKLFATLEHFEDLAHVGALSSEKKVKQQVRLRLFGVLGYLRLGINALAKSAKRSGDFISLPVLANESRELAGTLDALEKQFAVCIGETKLPPGVGVGAQ
jgi:hypothetical protein